MATYGALKVQETFEYTGGEGIPPPPPPPPIGTPITVFTDKDSYTNGETIIVSGKVGELLSGYQISLQVFEPRFGNQVAKQQFGVGPDKKYRTEVTAGGGLWRSDGTYTIIVLYGSQFRSAETTFEFSGSGVPLPEPLPLPDCKPLPFVDSTKDSQYYLDRYNNEPTYKDWFDSTFPDYIIEEAICIDKPTTPPPKPEPQPTCDYPSFIDTSKSLQYYLDRYHNEPAYNDWFHSNYPQYNSLEEALCLDEYVQQVTDWPVQIEEPVPEKLPEWVRNLFIWYAEKRISEAELLDAIQFLIDQGILKD